MEALTKETRWARFMEVGSVVETVGGIAGVVLAVIGLANVAAPYMVAIASIVLGAALLFQGGIVAAEYAEIMSRFEGGPYAEFGGGIGAEALAGTAAIVLGILTFFGSSAISDTTLMASAAIVLGGGLVLSSGLVLRLNSVKIEVSERTAEAKHAAQRAISGTSFLQILVGLGVMILGVLALVTSYPTTLTLVSMLVVGASILLSGGSMFDRVSALFKH